MTILKKYSNRLYLKQWGLGFMKGSIAEIIRQRRTDLRFTWMPLDNHHISYADPFIFKTADGQINILFESVSSSALDGKISLMVCNEFMHPISRKLLLAEKEHLSYPFVYKENGRIYVFPENALSGALYGYEFDQLQRTLINKKMVIDQPLIDPTIVRSGGKYWLFATLLGSTFNRDLHIFYSDYLFGPYTAHAGNPVKQDLEGSRPAGNFIEVDGVLYRPAQNCSTYYGESLTINRIITLNTAEFREEPYMVIKPAREDEFNYGIHTINVVDDIIIADGQKSHFQPLQQLGRKIKHLLSAYFAL